MSRVRTRREEFRRETIKRATTARSPEPTQAAESVNNQELQAARARRNAKTGTEASAAVAPVASSGASLDPATRSLMESRFGHHFGDVRVHSAGGATSAVRDLGARAYTVGSDIVFDTGQYNPQTLEGKRLLAHELTHVVQQAQTPQTAAAQAANGADAEREARHVSHRVAGGEQAPPIVSSGGGVQCDAEWAGRGPDPYRPPRVEDLPAGNYVDAFETAYYNLSYRSVDGRLSKWIRLVYSDSTTIDVNIDEITDVARGDVDAAAAIYGAHVGPGRRIFPTSLNKATTPRLWDRKQQVLRIMDDYNVLWMLITFPTWWSLMPSGPVAVGPRSGPSRGSRGPVESPGIRQQSETQPPAAGKTTQTATSQAGTTPRGAGAPAPGASTMTRPPAAGEASSSRVVAPAEKTPAPVSTEPAPQPAASAPAPAAQAESELPASTSQPAPKLPTATQEEPADGQPAPIAAPPAPGELTRGAALARKLGYEEAPPGYHWAEVNGKPVPCRNPGFDGPQLVIDPATKKLVPRNPSLPQVAQEAGRLQEKVVTDITGWPKNTTEHSTSFGNVEPDYLPRRDSPTGKWVTAQKPEEAAFVADSKYYDASIVRLTEQIKGFIELAARTTPPSGQKTLILMTNRNATISPDVFAWAHPRGVTVRQLFQRRSR